ncbi:MAG TPA: hypothetical protein VHO01_09135 [Jatrophihabitans sp.]|nr:hypothetical protein [Jatrophihabitans sp.]
MAEFRTDRRLPAGIRRAVLVGIPLAVAAAALDRFAHLRQPLLLMLSVPLLVAVIVGLVRSSVADVLPAAPDMMPERGSPEYFVRLRHLERRLENGIRDQTEFDWSLRPLLVQLTADRLRYRHGILFRTQPVRAREIVGEELWQIMTPSPDVTFQPLDRRRLEALILQIERI